MIIPIGHDQAIRRLPWVTIAIIATCTLVQIYASFMAPNERELLRFISDHGDDASAARSFEQMLNRIPMIRFGHRTGSGLGLSLITSTFVHDGWFHLIGNMLFLFLAGSALEDRWGPLRFIAFYVLGGCAATLCFEATYSRPTILVGASGAVSALMGAFLLHFARAQITLWYWIFWRTGTFYMPASLALPIWLVEQIVWGMRDHSAGHVAGVAYAAHIGGFVIGAILVRMFARRAGATGLVGPRATY